jgi:cytoskeletal protein RodZ
MKEIGAKLRAAREAKNITLLEIQEQTKIRLRYLEAIESGNWEVIPGEVYRRGFICNYANAVGLDGEALLHEYSNAKAPQPVEPAPKVRTPDSVAGPVVEKPQTVMVPDEVLQKPQRVRWIPLLAVLGLIMVGMVVLYVLVSGLTKNKQAITKEKPAVVQNLTQAATLKTAQSNVTNGKNAQQPVATTVQQLYPALITVYAEFSENVWVQVKADGQIKYLGGGATFTAKSPKQLWTANREMVIRVGNPAGIRLTQNGKDLGMLGASGKPRTITLTASGMVTP